MFHSELYYKFAQIKNSPTFTHRLAKESDDNHSDGSHKYGGGDWFASPVPAISHCPHGWAYNRSELGMDETIVTKVRPIDPCVKCTFLSRVN